MAEFILKRSVMEEVCAPGLAQFDARAAAQLAEGIGNGVDCYYPDGFTDAEWLRIGTVSAKHAMWMVRERERIGIPAGPSSDCYLRLMRMFEEQQGR